MAAYSRVSVSTEQCRLWTPFKDLQAVIHDAIIRSDSDAQADLERVLKKHRTAFLSLLGTSPKKLEHRQLIQNASKDGILLTGWSLQENRKLDEAIIAETFILSELFDINELEALELLLTGESQMAQYPGLPRGLIAVLLYHDGRRCLVTSLRTLVQARAGRCFSANLSRDLQNFITEFTDQLISDGILAKILGQLTKFDIDALTAKMAEQRALGKAKHRYQVLELMKETRQSLGDTLFYWSCQRHFTKQDTVQLINWLKTVDVKDKTLDAATISVLMALLYAIDTSILETAEDLDESVRAIPLLCDETFIPSIHDLIKSETTPWKCSGLHSVVLLCWSLTLRVASQHPSLPVVATSICEQDEDLAEHAIQNGVFAFLHDAVVNTQDFSDEEEFFMRKLHEVITSFIVQMPFKVKDLRDIGDESARIILAHQQDNSPPPPNLRTDFQDFLRLIERFYSKESNKYKLSEEFWCIPRPAPQKQITLHKFVKLAGDMVPAPLFVPYINLLTGLSASEIGAVSCFNLLKANSELSSLISWDHIFASMRQYFSNLRQEMSAQTPRVHHQPKDIAEQELNGLIAVCRLVRQVCDQSAEVRITMAESQLWSPIFVMFGLVGCGVPVSLKAEILQALAAFSMSPEIASNIWNSLELSQLVVTPTGITGGLVTELEEIESRLESYPMLKAFLNLMDRLCHSSGQPPESLGSGVRQPGFQPYLDFVIQNVFLRYNSKGYKNISEKWQISSAILSIFNTLLSSYDVKPSQAADLSPGVMLSDAKSPGYTIITLLLRSPHFFNAVLTVIHSGLQQLLSYDLHSTERSYVEKATLMALELLSTTLDKEDAYFDMLRQSERPEIVSRLEKLLLGINPSTVQAEHIVTIARYSALVSVLPEHVLHSVCILSSVCKQVPKQSDLLNLFLTDETSLNEIRSALAEGIELGTDVTEDSAYDIIRRDTSVGILQLLIDGLNLPSPNLSHFLLGFQINRPLSFTDFQLPGINGVQRTCLHAAMSLAEQTRVPVLKELVFQLIYSLCSNSETCAPVMRYLRTSHDFFFCNINKLPFAAVNQGDSVSVLRQHMWLLKATAIELRITSLNKQQSYNQRLISSLLDSITSEGKPLKGTNEADMNNSTFMKSVFNISSLTEVTRQKGISQSRSRLLRVLDSISFSDNSIGDITLEHFNSSSIMQVMSSCEEQATDTGLVSVNIRLLHKVLMQEINLSQHSNVELQPIRNEIMKEVRDILNYAVELNSAREDLHTRLHAFDAWRQVAEIILSTCMEETGDDRRRVTIIEVLNAVINKCLQDDTSDDLISPACGVILSLMASLRQSMFDETTKESSLANSLEVLLKGIANLIVATAGYLQRARANLYGALLYYLQVVETQPRKNTDLFESGGVLEAVIGQESTSDKLARESINVINGYGDSLLEVLCRDACDGLNLSRMLALSCLDCISTLDVTGNNVLRFMNTRGYIRHLLDSLVQSDGALIQSLNESEPLKHIYIYESVMCLLTRLAMSPHGSQALLNAGLMLKLAQCAVFDSKPNRHPFGKAEEMEYESFLPSVHTRYRQILIPCLKLCLTVLVSSGTDNENAANQVMRFIVSHADVFHTMLRDHEEETVESFQELSLLTAVLSRAASFAPMSYSDDEKELTFRGQVSRIQRKLGSLLSKYMLLDDWASKIKSMDHLSASQRSQMLLYVREISTNITSYCRYVIAHGSSDPSYCRVLFAPSLNEAMNYSDSHTKVAKLDYSQISSPAPPSLSLVLIQLKQASNQIMEALDEHKQLSSQLSAVTPDTKPDALAAGGKEALLRLEHLTHAVHLLSSVIENCLYIIWKHLDFFLIHCIPEDSEKSLYQTHQRSQASMRKLTESSSPAGDSTNQMEGKLLSSGVSRDQLRNLKDATPKVLNETLLQKIGDYEQLFASKRSHFGYVNALLRRLRRLINLHCS